MKTEAKKQPQSCRSCPEATGKPNEKLLKNLPDFCLTERLPKFY
jgi:hypothetical protein